MDDRFDDLIEAARVKLQAGETPTKDEANAYMAQGLFNPTNQVYFRAGLIACREYMARFVEAQSPEIAASIRANWWPAKLGEDFGPPRLMRWEELTEGEYGTADFKVKEGEISPTLEALPIAHQFLQTVQEPPSNTVFRMPMAEPPPAAGVEGRPRLDPAAVVQWLTDVQEDVTNDRKVRNAAALLLSETALTRGVRGTSNEQGGNDGR